MPPIHMPFFFEAAILSRIRSPVTSRSNWAKDRSTFRVSRPMEVVVLNCWVTDTKLMSCLSKVSTIFGKVSQLSRQPVYLVDNDGIDSFGGNVLKQAFKCRPFHVSAGEAAVVVFRGNRLPALMALAENIGFACLALGMERIERLLETFLGGFAGVNRATHAGGYGHTV